MRLLAMTLFSGWSMTTAKFLKTSHYTRKVKDIKNMSTRSAIVEKTETGYRGIYCHYDGYLSHNGKILLDHYQDAATVSALIDLGDISSLGERVSSVRRSGFESVTVAYGRDRGEERTEPVTGSTVNEVASQIGHDGYVYVFYPEKKEWKVQISYPYKRVLSLKKALDINADSSIE